MQASSRQEDQNHTAVALEELVATDSHLDLAEELIAGHPWPKDKAEELTSAVAGIRRRREDGSLYLAVIGEFSSGKSSWINALLRQDLVPTSIVQATTAAVTVLRHGSRPAVEIKLCNGEELSFVLGTDDAREDHEIPVASLAEPLARYVADEAVAKEVASVTVFSPAPALADGLVLLDTPGTNVDNPRHVEVARWAIHEMCDVAVVLIPARLQLARSFARFLSTHLADSLHRCIFVVTMIDRIEPEERDSVLQVVRGRIESLLGVENPTVLPVSAAAVLAGIAPERYELPSRISKARMRRLVEESDRAEASIREALRRQRALIVLERLAALLDRLYHELSIGLDAMERRYEEEHRALEAGRISDLEAFVEQSKAALGVSLDSCSTKLTAQVRRKIGRVRRRVSRKLSAALDQAATDTALAGVMKSTAPAAIEAARAGLKRSLATLVKDLYQAAAAEAEEFENEFVVLYRTLARLGANVEVEPSDFRSSQALQTGILTGDLQGLAMLADSDQKFAEGLAKSFAVAGLVAGAAVGGPFGAVVGGVCGLLAGVALSPNADKLRPTYQTHLDEVLVDIFGAAQTAVLADLGAHHREALRRVEDVVDRYVERYDALVRRKVSEDERKARDLAAHRRKLKKDAAQIARRQRELSASRDGLRKTREI